MRLIHKLTTIASCLLWTGLSTAESLPRTSSGKPDFEGNWDYGSLTPLERPEQFKDKSHFTPEEAQDFVANFGNYIEGVFEKLEGAEFVGLDTWLDWGAFVEPDLRTSRVVDPSNGKIPERTDSAKTRLKKLAGRRWTKDGAVIITAEKHRTQPRNRAEAEEKLVTLIKEALFRPKYRVKTRPTLASKRRRLDGKKQRGQVKELRGKISDD